MKFVALLRGINVGGKNIIRMAALRTCVEQEGFEGVETFIQSGNLIFESRDKDAGKLTRRIETALSRTFAYDARVVVRSQPQLEAVLTGVPKDWKRRTDLRCYVAFIREPVSPRQVIGHLVVTPGVDVATPGKGVVYLTTRLSGLNKSGFRKMIGTPVYQDLTIRNYRTCQKLHGLMDRR